MSRPYVKTNGARIYIDPNRLAQDKLRLAPHSEDEQCEECGANLVEHGKIVNRNAKQGVQCEECKTIYEIYGKE